MTKIASWNADTSLSVGGWGRVVEVVEVEEGRCYVGRLVGRGGGLEVSAQDAQSSTALIFEDK